MRSNSAPLGGDVESACGQGSAGQRDDVAVPRISQVGAFDAVADVAASLSHAELLVLIALSKLALADPAGQYSCRASLLDLERLTGLARSNVRVAVDLLIHRNFVSRRPGRSNNGAAFQVNLLQTRVFASSSGVPITGTPEGLGVPITGTPVIGRGAYNRHTLPPEVVAHQQTLDLALGVQFDRLEVSTVLEVFDRGAKTVENAIDVMNRARPKHYDCERLNACRAWLRSLADKRGRPDAVARRTPLYPDVGLASKLLALAEWPVLETLFYDLLFDPHIKVGDSWGWFTAVVLQRVWGIHWQAVSEAQKARPSLVSRRAVPAAAATPPPEQAAMAFSEGDGASDNKYYVNFRGFYRSGDPTRQDP